MRVIIAGGRDFNDYKALETFCDKVLSRVSSPICILSGKCPTGADVLGEAYAKKRGYLVDEYPADWSKYDDAAGPIRNREMAKNADALIVFLGEKSRGSRSMIKEAKRHGLLIRIYKY